jgi:hypothetical protein
MWFALTLSRTAILSVAGREALAHHGSTVMSHVMTTDKLLIKPRQASQAGTGGTRDRSNERHAPKAASVLGGHLMLPAASLAEQATSRRPIPDSQCSLSPAMPAGPGRSHRRPPPGHRRWSAGRRVAGDRRDVCLKQAGESPCLCAATLLVATVATERGRPSRERASPGKADMAPKAGPCSRPSVASPQFAREPLMAAGGGSQGGTGGRALAPPACTPGPGPARCAGRPVPRSPRG